VTSIRDHSFRLDSPGQSMSWKEKEFIMFCTLYIIGKGGTTLYTIGNQDIERSVKQMGLYWKLTC
jgi:hypothetical protein